MHISVNDFYVDHLLIGGYSYEELLEKREGLIAILVKGGF